MRSMLSLSTVLAGLVACTSAHPVSPDPRADPATDASAADASTTPPLTRPVPATLAAATEDGFAFFDTDGRILARTATEAKVHDLVVDGPGGRVFTFETNDEGEGGYVVERSAHALAAPRTRAFVDGRARLAPVSAGLVLFEDAYGARWRVLGEGRPPQASLAAPMPSSVWTDGARIHAFGREADGAWATRVVEPTKTGLVAVETRAVAGIFHESARAAGAYLIDLEAGRLVVRAASGDAVGVATTSVGADGIVDARPLRDDLVAVVTSGPPRVSIVRVGDSLAGSLAASQPLDAVYAEARLPPRALVIVPASADEDVLVVATTRSVTTFRVTVGADGVSLSPALRVEGVHAPASGPL